jgi:hypothetical protein
MALSAGCALLHAWHIAITTLLLLGIIATLHLIAPNARTARLSAIVGLSLYVTAVCVLWILARRTDAESLSGFLAGSLLALVSFTAWLASLRIEGIGAWVSRGVTFATLTASVFILAGLLF